MFYCFFGLRRDLKKIMADIDVLNAAVAQLGTDETAEEALGLKIEAGITALQAQVAAGAPNLQPAIAALQALHTQITSDTAQGGTLLASLPQPAQASPPTTPS